MPAVGLEYSPDGRWLAVRDTDMNSVVLLDAETHEMAARFTGHEVFVKQSVKEDNRLAMPKINQANWKGIRENDEGITYDESQVDTLEKQERTDTPAQRAADQQTIAREKHHLGCCR
jgi:hypothetical protein